MEPATPGGSGSLITLRSKRSLNGPSIRSARVRYPSSAQVVRMLVCMPSDKSQAFALTVIGPSPLGCGHSMPCYRKTLPFVPLPSPTPAFTPSMMHVANSTPIGSFIVQPAPRSIAHSYGIFTGHWMTPPCNRRQRR